MYFTSTILIIKNDISDARAIHYSNTKKKYIEHIHDNVYILLEPTKINETTTHTGLAQSLISNNMILLKKKQNKLIVMN